MKIFLSVIFLFLFSTHSVYAQVSDSLYKALPDSLKPIDRNKPSIKEVRHILSQAGVSFPTQRYSTELDKMVTEFKRETKASGDKEIKIYNTLTLGKYFAKLSFYEEALSCFRNVMTYIGDKGDHDDILGEAYREIAGVFTLTSRQDSAIINLYKALAISKAGKDLAGVNAVYEKSFVIYYKLELFDKAIYYNNLFLSYLSNEKWSNRYTDNYLSNSLCYSKIFEKTGKAADADSARTIAERVMREKRKDSLYWWGGCYTFLGYLSFYKKNYKEALAYFDSSLVDKYRVNDIYYNNSSRKYFYRALCLINTGSYEEGKKALDATKAPDFYDQRLVNQVLYDYAVSKQDWKAAFNYHKEFVRYSDSLKLVKNNGIVLDAEQKYAVAAKQTAITELQNKGLEDEKRQDFIITMTVISVLVLFVVIIGLHGLFRRARLRRISERQQLAGELYKMEVDMNDERAMQQLEWQSVISGQRKEIAVSFHDEIITGIASFRDRLALNKQKVDEYEAEMKAILPGLEEDAKALYTQASDFFENMHRSGLTDVGNYDSISLLQNLSARFADEKVLKVICQCNEEEIKKHFTNTIHYELYLVIKEAIANIIKHANATQVNIRVFLKDQICTFTVADNGKGFDLSAINAGFGLQSIEKRIKNIGGNVQVNSDDEHRGTVLKGSFPVLYIE
jgi:signal transduction histidine kinase